jgi:RNA polymerase sigma-70 factor (ECF subfamily)
MSDAELIARVLLDDDRHAFATLVRQHQSATRLFLRRLTRGDVALADDLAQETFLRAYRNLHAYRGEARFSSWLFRIAHRLFLSEMRKTHRRHPHVDVDHIPQPANVVEHRVDLKHDLDRALLDLSDDERAAILLCYQHDLSHEEASQVLDYPVGTVKTHIARGKSKIGKRLKVWQEDIT